MEVSGGAKQRTGMILVSHAHVSRLKVNDRITYELGSEPMQLEIPHLDGAAFVKTIVPRHIEGAEYTVVSTIDFGQTSIDTFCVELDGHDPEKDARVTKLLRERGYGRCNVPDGRNGWFRRDC